MRRNINTVYCEGNITNKVVIYGQFTNIFNFKNKEKKISLKQKNSFLNKWVKTQNQIVS